MENTKHFAPAPAEEGALVVHLEQRAEAERRAVERELHDEVSGMLAAARMDVSFLKSRVPRPEALKEHIERLDGTLDRAIRATRKIMQGLRPALLDHFGLPVALKHHVEETCRASGLQCSVLMPEEFHDIDAQLQIAAFRVVQELLASGVGLQAFEVELFEQPETYRLDIRLRNGAVPISDEVLSGNLELSALRIWILSLGGQWTVQRVAAAATHSLNLPRRR
jgi:two-component system sensor histidine kinase UhpB